MLVGALPCKHLIMGTQKKRTAKRFCVWKTWQGYYLRVSLLRRGLCIVGKAGGVPSCYMQPYYSHSSCENTTPSSSTSLLASCKGVPPRVKTRNVISAFQSVYCSSNCQLSVYSWKQLTQEGLLVVILTKIKYVILLFYLQWHQSNGMQLGQEGRCHWL